MYLEGNVVSEETLKRIADALEDIASIMRGKQARQKTTLDVRRDELLELMRQNADRLIGKMDMPEIVIALGIKMDATKRRAMGEALREYGAVKGISNNRAYYLFPGTERKALASGEIPDRSVLRIDALKARLTSKNWKLNSSMTAKQIVNALGLKKIPGDEVALVAAMRALKIEHRIVNDVFNF